MATGRRPLPTNVKLLRGNPGKRPLNDSEPQPRAVIPTAPKHLDDEARREWRRMAKTLHELGLLTEVDRSALAAYCISWSRWVLAEAKVREFGLVLKSPDKGWPVQSPYLPIANRAMEQMVKLAGEFGMTPSSRSRLSVGKAKDAPVDEMEGLLSGRRSG